MDATRVKALSADRVGGYLVVWGDPEQRDLHREYFTPESDLALDWYAERPMLYQHGLDGSLGPERIGKIDHLEIDRIGVWAEAQLDLRHTYLQAIQQLIAQGVLCWSSGSVPHLAEVTADGWIKRWPIIEGSLTPTPAEPRYTDVKRIKQVYQSMGLNTELWEEQPMTIEETPRKRLPVSATVEGIKTISVSSPYDGLDALDLVHGYVLLSAAKSFNGVSEQYGNALAHKIRKAGWVTGIKANELMHTTNSGFGDSWIPELWSAQIWQKAREDNVVLPLFRNIEMPANPFDLPIEGADPTVYYVPETVNEAQLVLTSANPIPDSKIGSGKVQLVAKKLALRVGFSAELVEDAILPVLNIYREQAVRAIADSIDNVLINGDTVTTANTNINLSNGTPSGNERYLALNGLRKLALVTNTENAVAMGAAPTLAKMRDTRFTMASRYSARPGDLAWIVDSGTYAKLLSLTEFLTVDKAGALATAQTGQIGFIDGTPVFLSAEVPRTGANGLIGATNDKGTAICVYRPGWFVGYRRKIAVDVTYLPYYDSYQLTATVRLAFAPFDTDVTSVLYNITV